MGADAEVVGRVPQRGFFGTWLFLFQNHLGLLAVFILCLSVIVHIILATLPTSGPIVSDEYLLSLAARATELGVDAQPSAVVTLAGFTLHDRNDWLNPAHLGLRIFERPQVEIGTRTFDVDLWDESFFFTSPVTKRRYPKKALPSSAWWQPWVIAPGIGSKHSINQHPYTLQVIAKQQPTSLSDRADKAGLQILAPFVETITASGGSLFGVQQNLGTKQIGFILGVELADVGDYVERHYIQSYGPLEIVKVWKIVAFQRNDDGFPLIDQPKLQSTMKSRIVRGSPYISMEIPAGVFMILDTLVQDISEGTKNSISRVTDLSSSLNLRPSSCTALNKIQMTSDAFEILLSDRTRWALILDEPIVVTCSSSLSNDRFQTATPLRKPLLARLALLDMTDHVDVLSGRIPGALATTPATWAKICADMRWGLMAHVKRNAANSVSRFVTEINQVSDNIDEALKQTFTQFPLRDQLQSLSNKMEFTLTTVRWNENEVLDAVDSLNPELIILPENFIENPDDFWVSDRFRASMLSSQIGDRGRTVLGIAGTQSRTISTFFDRVFGLSLIPAGVWNSAIDPLIQRVDEINVTLPTNADSTHVVADILPINMPQTLSIPSSGNSIEMVSAREGTGWPFVTYCRLAGGATGQTANQCDGAVHIFYFIGRGSVQWIGMDWLSDSETHMSDWSLLFERSVASAGCTDGMRNAGACINLRNVLLLEDVDAAQQESRLPHLRTALVTTRDVQLPNGTVIQRDQIDLDSTVNFLRGTKTLHTRNVGNPFSTIVDSDTETLHDFILRHALIVPVGSTTDIELDRSSALLHHQLEVKAIANIQAHSLYPPTVMTTTDLLFDPLRAMVYMTHLQRKLEYKDPIGHFANVEPISLEDDETTCLVSVVGLLCARSFGPAPKCRFPPIIPDQQDLHEWPECVVNEDGSVASTSWDVASIQTELMSGNSVIFSHLHQGQTVGILVNFPTASWDMFVRTPTGLFTALSKNIHPTWQRKIKWAITEDVFGTWKLDGDTWLKNDAADDLNTWVRMIHRYAQIALAADLVGSRNEKRTVLNWLEAFLVKFLNNQFDNKGLLYDETWGGIVPCGCDRDMGKDYCVPPPRMGYFDLVGKEKALGEWMPVACPALTTPANELGAGYYVEHHALWGYIVFSAAVAIRFDPSFANRRLRLRTAGGVRRPRIHHVIMALIQDYANPTLVRPYNENPEMDGILQRYYPGARYKDFWRMHSYSSGANVEDASGPSQYSPSEAAFGYWAASMYAEAIGDEDLRRWARLLTGMELLAGNAFWHIKEHSETVPHSITYLGAIGKVSEAAITFQSRFSVSAYDVFHALTSPLTMLTFEQMEPGWSLWMHERWRDACRSDEAGCAESGADLGLALLDMMAEDWEDTTGVAPFSKSSRSRNASAIAYNVMSSITNIPCFQMGSYDCGMHTLSNSVFWAALVFTWGGAPAALNRDDGNGRFQVH